MLIIDDSIRFHHYPSKEEIINRIHRITGEQTSSSSFEKWIHEMRNVYGAPVEYLKEKNGYYYTRKYSFAEDVKLIVNEIFESL